MVLRTCRWSKKNWFIIYHRQLWKVVIFCLTKMENIIWLSVGCLKQYIRIIRETGADTDFVNLEIYLKRVWFSNGIHHHYASDKFVPAFTPEFFRTALKNVDAAKLPLADGETVDTLCDRIFPVIFDPKVMSKRVNQADGQDLVLTSAANYYDGVTQQEAEEFYNALKNPADDQPVMFGMNSRLVKEKRTSAGESMEIRRIVWGGHR